MADIFNPTITVKIGDEPDAEEFIFRVPTPFQRAKLGVRESAIRRQLDPGGMGWDIGVDLETAWLIRGMALLELFLDKANVKWPFTEVKGEKNAPDIRVDIEKFPHGKEAQIIEIGRRFGEALDRFHGRGTGDGGQPSVSETVANS